MNPERVQSLVRQLLGEIGEDPDREGLLKTPERIARALEFLTGGYRQDAEQLIHGARFAADTENMIIVRDIEMYSLCEDHLLPFFGRAHIGYIPKGKLFGVSKLARLVDMHARRLQIQQRMTDDIARTIQSSIEPRGLGVVVVARHLCMMMRGVQKQNSELITSSVLGSFRESVATRNEFLSLIGQWRR